MQRISPNPLFSIALAAGLLTLATALVPAAAAGKSAQFKVTTVQKAPGGNLTITSQAWIGQKQARIIMKHPLQGERTWLVTNGSFYMLDPRSKKALKMPLPPEFQKRSDNFDFLLGRFVFDAGGVVKSGKRVGAATVSGFACDVFKTSTKKKDATRTVTVWMPKKMSPRFPVKALVEQKVTKPGANLTSTLAVTLSGIKLNAAIPASVFAVPRGYTVTTAPMPKPPAKK